MSDLEPDKLKVAELRDELKVRGLDTKGNKAALVSRLKQAMGSNGGDLSGMEYTGGDDGDGDDEQARDDGDDEQAGDDDQARDDGDDDQTRNEEQAEDESAQYHEDAQVDEAPNDNDQENIAEKNEEATAIDEAIEANEEPANGNAEDQEPPIILGDEFRTIDEATQDDTEEGNTDRKRKRSHDRHRRSRSRSRDKRRLPSSRDRKYGRSSPARKVEMDDTAWEALTVFTLDRFDADLNLRFNDRGIKAHPLTVGGFAYMWSGVRANYGVRSGKVAFEVKVLEHLNVDHLPREEPNPHSVRVGWSLNSTSLNLGEEPLSYGYGSTGQAAADNNFFDYGQTFGVGDVVTAYLDFESDPAVLSFAKNGEDLGKSFEIEKEELGENALFPHILTKNAEFECNFGAREGPYFPLKDSFKFLEEVPAEERVRGHPPPEKKEDCEVIMTVGLPGSGKTYWTEKHIADHPEKRYNVLGTNSIIDKMRILGKPRRQNHNGEWSVLIDKANKCLNRFIELSARKKRNFIIDQVKYSFCSTVIFVWLKV
jgi:heterogeneous nuclear ribonucleoprotein U-like protein 1